MKEIVQYGSLSTKRDRDKRNRETETERELLVFQELTSVILYAKSYSIQLSFDLNVSFISCFGYRNLDLWHKLFKNTFFESK